MKDLPLTSKLRALERDKPLAMHMPGHKRNISEFPYLAQIGGDIDITEIDGFDNLNSARGILSDLCGRAARLYGARRTFISVNGSTGAVLAAISSVTTEGDSILVARNCHKSVYNAVEINGLDADYILPSTVFGFGFFASDSPSDVENALGKKRYKAVVITSPTYEGVISDIEAISEIVHRHGAVLVVDSAHGAHLGFGGFCGGATEFGADIVVQSLHKTLPSLTQTALLHICTPVVDEREIARKMSVFCTSSPSYVLLSSVEGCISYMEKYGDGRLKRIKDELDDFYEKAAEFNRLKVFDYSRYKNDDIYAFDTSKIYIDTVNLGLSGYEFKKALLQNCGVELEAAYNTGALAMVCAGDDGESVNRLFDSLAVCDLQCGKDLPSEKKIDKQKSVCVPAANALTVLPKKTYSSRAAFDCAAKGEAETVLLDDGLNRICAENVWLYPPGVPIIVAGEVIGEEILSVIYRAIQAGAQVESDCGLLPDKIKVLTKTVL